MTAVPLVYRKLEERTGTSLRQFKVPGSDDRYFLDHHFDDDSRTIVKFDGEEFHECLKFTNNTEILGLNNAGDFLIHFGHLTMRNGHWGYIPFGGEYQEVPIQGRVPDWHELELVEIEVAKQLITHNLFERTPA